MKYPPYLMTLDEAIKASMQAKQEGLRGLYPVATIVLAEEVERLWVALDKVRDGLDKIEALIVLIREGELKKEHIK